jgi:hypothetical protein
MDASLFAEFLEFQKFKAAQAAMGGGASAAPPPPSAVEDDNFSSVSGSGKHSWPSQSFVRKVDYERTLQNLFKLIPNRVVTKNYGLWKVFVNLYHIHPECFGLLGEGHPCPDGRFYFSFQYKLGHNHTNFHVYGQVHSTLFKIETVDILMGEDYRNAVDFRR